MEIYKAIQRHSSQCESLGNVLKQWTDEDERPWTKSECGLGGEVVANL